MEKTIQEKMYAKRDKKGDLYLRLSFRWLGIYWSLIFHPNKHEPGRAADLRLYPARNFVYKPVAKIDGLPQVAAPSPLFDIKMYEEEEGHFWTVATFDRVAVQFDVYLPEVDRQGNAVHGSFGKVTATIVSEMK